MTGLGDTVDPRTREYEYEARDAEKRLERAKQTDAERAEAERLKREAQTRISQLNTRTLRLNKGTPDVPLPLDSSQETFRKLSVAGDIEGMARYLPFSQHRWSNHFPVGAYRFKIVNGKKEYIPFTESFLRQLMARIKKYPKNYIEPGVTVAECQLDEKLKGWIEGQKVAAKHYPKTNWRHVYPIFFNPWICEKYDPSFWVKWREPIAIAVGAVAATYLGPAVMEKISGAMGQTAGGGAATGGTAAASGAGATAGTAAGGAAGGAAGAATGAGAAATGAAAAGSGAATQWGASGLLTMFGPEAAAASGLTVGTAAQGAAAAAGLFQQIQSTGNEILGYVNQARTIEAIANGDIPPPPISIEGDSFLDWATQVAQAEMKKKLQRELTQAEEERIRREVAALQKELAGMVPPDTPKTPSTKVPREVQEKSAELAEKNKLNSNLLLSVGAVILGALILRG